MPDTNDIPLFSPMSNIFLPRLPAALQQLRAVITNRHFQDVLVTATGMALGRFILSETLASIVLGGRKRPSIQPFRWLEYSGDYLPPRMELFVEKDVPFAKAAFSPLACPHDSEHLESAFDLLRYQHLFRTLGVPSVANHDIVVAPLLRDPEGTDTSFWSLVSQAPVKHYLGMGGMTTVNGELYVPKSNHTPWWNTSLTAVICGIFVLLVPGTLGMWERHEVDCGGGGGGEICGSDSKVCRRYSEVRRNHSASVPSTAGGFKRSPRLVLAALVNPESPIDVEDIDSGLPYIVLQYSDDYTDHTRSDDELLKDACAPVDLAALRDALQDALPSAQQLRNWTEGFLRDLPRLLLFWLALFLFIALRLATFLVTCRFGLRGFRQLGKQLKGVDSRRVKTSKRKTRTRLPEVVEQEVEPVPAIPESIAEELDAYEEIVMRWVAASLGTPVPRSATADNTVETELALVLENGGRKGKDKSRDVSEPRATMPRSSHSATVHDTVETELALVDESSGRNGKDNALNVTETRPFRLGVPEVMVKMRAAYEKMVMTGLEMSLPGSQPSCSTSYTVETELAPVAEEVKAEGGDGHWTIVDKRRRGRRGKKKSDKIAEEREYSEPGSPVMDASTRLSTNEQPLPFMNRLRGRRGHGRGRGPSS